MGDVGEHPVNARLAVAAVATVTLALGCGGVASDSRMKGADGGGTSLPGIDGAGGASTGNDGAGGGASITPDGEASLCPGTQVRIGSRCVTLGMVSPCAQPRPSGFPGDSQCIDAPEPVVGMQLHFGPKDYTDPDEVAKFVLPPGVSREGCMYMTSPNQTDLHVKEWHARVRPGAYESILFQEAAARPDSSGPESCVSVDGSAAGLVSVVGTELDLSLDGGAPEYAGAGMSMPAVSQLSFYVNMANMTDAPLLVEAWLNGVYAGEPVTMEVAPITWLGGLAMNIAPHSNSVVHAGGSTNVQTSCVASADVNVLALLGSTGSHTTHMAGYVERAGAPGRDEVYESFDWSAPRRLYYDSTVRNPSPDPGTGMTGGPSGALSLKRGDAVSWECAIDNPTSSTLTFSGDVFIGELCNFYGVYAAGTAPWNCYSQ